MKTTLQWLETLPKGLKESAIKNTLYEVQDYKLDKLSEAIYFISWVLTEEEIEFWDGFYECLKWAEGDN